MLTDRQKMILRMVVDDYVVSAEPIGSRTISKHPNLGLSAATIRNEMADLEEMGYLEQPHASAGRIPSQQGYRYYVDNLVNSNLKLSVNDFAMIKSLFTEKIDEMERVAQQTAVVLSGLTQYTGLVLGPQVYDTVLKNLQIIPLNDHSAVVIVVTSTGQVQNRTVTFPEGIAMAEVERLVNIVNIRLQGTPMYKMRSRMLEELMHEVARSVGDYEEAIRLLDQIAPAIGLENEARVYMGGATNMLLQPEFQDIAKVQPVLSWLEHRDRVVEALKADGRIEQHPSVRIGIENHVETLQDCSLITATYHVSGVPVGVIGVVGPTRMEYGRVIRLLRHVSLGLSELYSKFYNGS